MSRDIHQDCKLPPLPELTRKERKRLREAQFRSLEHRQTKVTLPRLPESIYSTEEPADDLPEM